MVVIAGWVCQQSIGSVKEGCLRVKVGYPETEEQWEKYGAQLPDVIEEMADIEIGCVSYQALVAAGVAVEACTNCPLIKQQ